MSAYNHAAYVEQAIESILAQTYDNFELLVIDDGSSDDTAAIIEKLSRTHGFYFKRQENRGLPVTLNELVQISSGDYITACASDDFWPSTRLDEQVSLLVNNPEYDIVHSDVFYVDTKGFPFNPKKFNKSKPVNGTNEYIPFIAHLRRYNTTTMMARRSSWLKVGLYNESIGVEDFEWWMRATKILNIHYSPSKWTYYRQHSNNFVCRQDGALIAADSHYHVARKIGFVHGIIFLATFVPFLVYVESIARRHRRYLFLLLLPFYFWSISYLKSLVYIFIHPSVVKALQNRFVFLLKNIMRHIHPVNE